MREQNFNNHAIVKFLESIGAAFGACQNAYTSADETVFQLTVSSSQPQSQETTQEEVDCTSGLGTMHFRLLEVCPILLGVRYILLGVNHILLGLCHILPWTCCIPQGFALCSVMNMRS